MAYRPKWNEVTEISVDFDTGVPTCTGIPEDGTRCIVNDEGVVFVGTAYTEYPPVFKCEFNEEFVSMKEGMRWEELDDC